MMFKHVEVRFSLALAYFRDHAFSYIAGLISM